MAHDFVKCCIFESMRTINTLKIILITSVLALVAVIALSNLNSIETEQEKQNKQLTETKASLPDVELMKNAAQRAKDIFKIVSVPIVR